MTQLMIYVERIVRPVRAVQSRKLRMRRELMTHLQLAMEEERSRNADEAVAIERAAQRLGHPQDLTRQLQRSVPFLERIVLAHVPFPRRIERCTSRALYGAQMKMTAAHISMCCAMAGLLAGVPMFGAGFVRAALTSGTPPIHATSFFIGGLLGLNLILLCSYRFVFAAAEPAGSVSWRRISMLAAAVLALHIALMCLIKFAVTGRGANALDIAVCMGMTSIFLLGSALIGRWVAMLRGQYDEWLGLDIGP